MRVVAKTKDRELIRTWDLKNSKGCERGEKIENLNGLLGSIEFNAFYVGDCT